MSEESETGQPLVANMEHVEDQGNIVKSHVEYQLFGRPVEQEGWEQYNAKRHRRELEGENKRNMDMKERIQEEHEA